MKELPVWITSLENEDLNFLKRFVMASGSLKEIAKQYDVTYPTIRLRLDRLIQKIEMSEEEMEMPFIAMVKEMAIEEKMDLDTAKKIINAYKDEKELK